MPDPPVPRLLFDLFHVFWEEWGMGDGGWGIGELAALRHAGEDRG